MVSTIEWVLPSESPPVGVFVRLWLVRGVVPEPVVYCPLEAPSSHCASAVTMAIVLHFVLWLDAHETFCSTSLCVHPATQTPVSQSEAGFRDPIRFETGVLDQFGGYIVGGGKLVSHCNCNDTVKSVHVRSCDWVSQPCISVQSHHAQNLAAKLEHDCLQVSLSYIKQPRRD